MKNSGIQVLSLSKGRTTAFSVDNSIIKKSRTLDTLPGGEFSMHAHHYCKLMYITDADDFYTRINDCKISFMPGFVYFMPAYTLHTPTNHYTGSVTSYASLTFFISDKKLFDALSSPFFLPCNDELKENFTELLDFKNSSRYNKEELNEKVEKLLYKLLGNSSKTEITSASLPEEDGNEFISLIKYICEHYCDDLTLSDLAALVHTEKTYFAKKFKSIYNITPINYLYALRLSRSLDELTFSDSSIEEVALSVGFKRTSAYSSAFKRAYDISPNEYRKRAKDIWLK